MLSYGCRYYIFTTENPFRSVGITQEELLEITLKAVFASGINSESIKISVDLILEEGVDHDILHIKLTEVLVAALKTTDAKEFAIKEANDKKSALIKEKNASKTKGISKMSHYQYVMDEKCNKLTELVLLLHISLSEFDEGIAYFNSNYIEKDNEITLYVLLRQLFLYDLKDCFVQAYDLAIKNKVEPREGLCKTYQYIIENGEMPAQMW